MKKLRIGVLSSFLLFSMNIMSANNTAMDRSPPPFSYNGDQAVFVDFISANYKITYDAKTSSAIVVSEIIFENFEKGQPIFDSVENPTEVILDGKSISTSLIHDPENQTSYRVLNEITYSGVHHLHLKTRLTELLNFKSNGIFSAFWADDLNDRGFLENYLPTNLEYDQYIMKFNVEFLNSNVEQRIYSNGKVKQISQSNYEIEFPAYFNSSAVYFHTAPKNYYKETQTTYTSVDGRVIPILVYSYSYNINDLKNAALNSLQDLEAHFGPFPHNTVTIYGAGSGGMEYHGATVTELRALSHELTHSYFGRGMMPANGDSGWMDEALASWHDKGYQESSSLNFSSSHMGQHSAYRRFTDREAYTKGANFMAYLNYLLKNQGGLKAYLRKMLGQYLFRPIISNDFENLFEQFMGRSVDDLFNQYIYGIGNKKDSSDKLIAENPFHPKRTKKTLNQMLFK